MYRKGRQADFNERAGYASDRKKDRKEGRIGNRTWDGWCGRGTAQWEFEGEQGAIQYGERSLYNLPILRSIAIVSPGNKETANALRSLSEKAVELLRDGIHLLIVDLFPSTPRDLVGIHEMIWSKLTDGPWDPRPTNKPLTVVSYEAGEESNAYLDPVAVGDLLPDAPLFLEPGYYVSAPLEATYQRSWSLLPQILRDLVETPGASGVSQ